MTKELRKRMIEKTERNRIKRIAWKKFLRKNPNWEGNTMRSISTAHQRQQVDRTQFQGIFQKQADQKTSMLGKISSKLQSIFRRRAV